MAQQPSGWIIEIYSTLQNHFFHHVCARDIKTAFQQELPVQHRSMPHSCSQRHCICGLQSTSRTRKFLKLNQWRQQTEAKLLLHSCRTRRKEASLNKTYFPNAPVLKRTAWMLQAKTVFRLIKVRCILQRYVEKVRLNTPNYFNYKVNCITLGARLNVSCLEKSIFLFMVHWSLTMPAFIYHPSLPEKHWVLSHFLEPVQSSSEDILAIAMLGGGDGVVKITMRLWWR